MSKGNSFTSHDSFVLVVNDEIDAVSKNLNDMKDYCCDTKKKGKVFRVITKIPFGGKIEDITNSIEFDHVVE